MKATEWIIKDWANNICFQGKVFNTFEDAWDFLFQEFPDDPESYGEYFVDKK